MNEVRRELERARAAAEAAESEHTARKKKPVRTWLRDAVLRRTSTKR